MPIQYTLIIANALVPKQISLYQIVVVALQRHRQKVVVATIERPSGKKMMTQACLLSQTACSWPRRHAPGNSCQAIRRIEKSPRPGEIGQFDGITNFP